MRLRKLLMVAFLIAAAAPAVGFIMWIEQAALDREKMAVEDKHLSMARQLAAMADVLVEERVSVLRRFASNTDQASDDSSFRSAVGALGFRHLCLVDRPTGLGEFRSEVQHRGQIWYLSDA
ncbi:MAG: hypothetical protein ACKVH0_18270, partial [Alphaproteobacteria bacterium]